MRLGREVSRKDPKNGKTYYKWRITPPEDHIRDLGWEKGDDLDAVVEGDALVIRRVKPRKG